jgi:zinc protease
MRHAQHVRGFGPPIAMGLVTFVAVCPAQAQELTFTKRQLSNGVEILAHEDRSTPVVTFQIFYRCGSRNEAPGITGISHLLEHMMFNGSAKYPPKSFDRLLEAAGGTSNGYTTRDFTTFMETFPPEAWDLVLDLESDRMRALTISPANLEQERGIVMEERRLGADNDDDGAIQELSESLLYLAHPYGQPVVGWMGDLEHITLDDVRRYHDRCYAPANALVSVSGDIDVRKVERDLEEAFGSLPPGSAASPPPWSEPPQDGLRYAELTRPSGQPKIRVGYRGPAPSDPDFPAFELLDHILSDGRASLLTDRLVYQEGVLVDASTWFEPFAQSTTYFIDGVVAEGVEPKDAVDAVERVVSELRATPPDAARLDRARRQAEMDLYRGLTTVEGKADLVGTWELLFGGPENLAKRPKLWAGIGPEALSALATRWLEPELRTVAVLFPKAAESAEPVQKTGGQP